MSRHRIGVVGFSQANFNTLKAADILQQELSLRAKRHPEGCVLVSGYTDLGVLAIAYRVATVLGMGTAGVACAKVYENPRYPCDEVHIVGEDWGDESENFLSQIDELIKVGGGHQSIQEFESFQGPQVSFDL